MSWGEIEHKIHNVNINAVTAAAAATATDATKVQWTIYDLS